MKKGCAILLACIFFCSVALSSAATITVFNPLNKTYETGSSTAKLRAIIDYNISGQVTGAWLTLADAALDIRKDSSIEYFELNDSDYNSNYRIRSSIYNRFIYSFTAEAGGRGEAHIYLLNSATLPNAGLIDIYYSRLGSSGSWSCLSNGAYKSLAEAHDSTKYSFKITGNHDGQYFTNYTVSINGNKAAVCLLPGRRLIYINKIEVAANDTTMSLSEQQMLAGTYYVELPAGSYVLRLYANISGEIASKSVSFSVTGRGNASYCSDGTAEGECSAAKPKYCNKAALIDNCNACGCASGTCNNNGLCVTTTTIQVTTSTIPTTTNQVVTTTLAVNQTTTTEPVILGTIASNNNGVWRYYLIIAVLLSFFIVIVFLLRKDMDRLKD